MPWAPQLVFTRSGTGALHTVGETFPWSRRSRFAFLTSNHNSVLGVREYARAARADYGAVSEEEVERWLQGGAGEGLPGLLSFEGGPERGAGTGSERQLLVQPQRQHPDADLSQQREGTAEEEEEGPTYHLFAFPSYDNYAGVMFPQRWVQAVQAKSTDRHRWKVLLDAAAYVACHPLNLTATPADFVDISFYKLFGCEFPVDACKHPSSGAALRPRLPQCDPSRYHPTLGPTCRPQRRRGARHPKGCARCYPQGERGVRWWVGPRWECGECGGGGERTN